MLIYRLETSVTTPTAPSFGVRSTDPYCKYGLGRTDGLTLVAQQSIMTRISRNNNPPSAPERQMLRRIVSRTSFSSPFSKFLLRIPPVPYYCGRKPTIGRALARRTVHSSAMSDPAKTQPQIDNNKKRSVYIKDKSPTKKRIVAERGQKRQQLQSEKNQTGPNEGSYADPAIRELFPHVKLPEHVLPQDGTGTADASDKNCGEIENKRTKKKVAFLLGYLGTNYAGFQMNKGQRTLQAELELAMLRCKLLEGRNFGYPNKYGWSTSGRTDKGVHACAQVCSAKIELLPDQTMDQVRVELNAVLPSDFRVLDVVRTTRSFCAKTDRDFVRYQYMIPSFVLADADFVKSLFVKVGAPTNGRAGCDPLSAGEVQKVKEELNSYRATPQQLEKLKEALKSYEGTKSFHNFSKGIKPKEARAVRYVMSFDVDDPIVFENGVEWIPTQVLGQSFLLHQVRKMVCMAIEVGRGVTPVETIARAFVKDDAIQVGLAPAQGLYLDMSYYKRYNEHKQQQNLELNDIGWTGSTTSRDDCSSAFKRWKDFRNGCVMKHVVSEEDKDGNFVKFLFLQEYLFGRDEAYNPDKRRVSQSSSRGQVTEQTKYEEEAD
jgi:tRNA pseudouridine38-40 synthase